MSESFGQRLRRLRERACLSAAQLARVSGLSRQAIREMEKGLYDPRWGTLQRLCLALEVTPEEFRDTGIAIPGRDALANQRPGPRPREDVPEKRPRGRPRKEKPATAEPKRKRGRPRKEQQP